MTIPKIIENSFKIGISSIKFRTNELTQNYSKFLQNPTIPKNPRIRIDLYNRSFECKTQHDAILHNFNEESSEILPSYLKEINSIKLKKNEDNILAKLLLIKENAHFLTFSQSIIDNEIMKFKEKLADAFMKNYDHKIYRALLKKNKAQIYSEIFSNENNDSILFFANILLDANIIKFTKFDYEIYGRFSKENSSIVFFEDETHIGILIKDIFNIDLNEDTIFKSFKNLNHLEYEMLYENYTLYRKIKTLTKKQFLDLCSKHNISNDSQAFYNLFKILSKTKNP